VVHRLVDQAVTSAERDVALLVVDDEREHADKADDALVADPMLQEFDQPCLVDPIEEASDVG
jgi:hypothetical protein